MYLVENLGDNPQYQIQGATLRNKVVLTFSRTNSPQLGEYRIAVPKEDIDKLVEFLTTLKKTIK